MSYCKAVARRITKLLKEKNMSIYRLEINGNLLHGTIANIMTAKNKNVTLRILSQICLGLDITLKDFFDDPLFDLENFNIA